MSTLTQVRHRSLGRAAFVVAGVVVATILNAWTLASGRATGAIYLWSSLVVAAPVALLLVYVAARWPYCAALGLAGLVAFNVALAVRVAATSSPEPLLVAVAVVLAAGAVLVRFGWARWPDVLGGLLLAYLGAAFLFEVGAVL
jgi:hypothetical protein